MKNTIKVSTSYIKMTGINQQELVDFYPIHTNRSKTEFLMSAHKLPEILEKFRGITRDKIDTLPPVIYDAYMKEIVARDTIADLRQNGPKHSCSVTPTLTLKPHQQIGREIASVRDRYAFFYDTRTGKTPLGLSIMYDDIVANPSHQWLVICPLILIENAWLEDSNRFIPDCPIMNCWATTAAKRIKLIKSDANIYITNTESFAKYRKYFDEIGLHGVFLDESSAMKSYKSEISKTLVDFSHTVQKFYLLSGAPAPNGEWEYFMQMRAIDYYCMPQSNTQFEQRYFINISYDPQYKKLVVRPDRQEELLAIIKDHAMYVDKEDVLDTPGRTFIEYTIDVPEQLAKHYKKLRRELYVELQNDFHITAPSAAAVLNKLNQVTSGFIIDTSAKKHNKYNDEQLKEWYLLDTYRFDELDALLARIGDEQVIIWANYHIEFEIISERFKEQGKTFGCIYGKTDIQLKNEHLRAFKDGRIQYLVANPASADKGLTLTNCHTVVYFSLNYSYELFKQSAERIYGDKSIQPYHCTYYIMMAAGSINEIIYNDVLQGKSQASIAILNHLKRSVNDVLEEY